MTTGGDVEVDNEGESGTKDEGRVGNTHAVDPLKDTWSFSIDRKTVESTRANVEVGVGGTQHEDEDNTVDNVIEGFDTYKSGGDNEGRGGSSNLLGVGDEKRGICSRDDETNNENTTDIEDQDTPEGSPDGDWDILSGILCLANGDTDELGSHVGEKSVNKSGPKTKEGGKALPVWKLFVEVLAHWTVGRIPIAETTGRKRGESDRGWG